MIETIFQYAEHSKTILSVYPVSMAVTATLMTGAALVLKPSHKYAKHERKQCIKKNNVHIIGCFHDTDFVCLNYEAIKMRAA